MTDKHPPKRAAPPIDKALTDWLDSLYPERCPETNDTDREVWIKVGRRQVVRKLLDEMGRQEKKATPR